MVKRCLIGASLFLSLFLVISSLAAQETNQSVADIARQERERKKDQAKKDQAKPVKVSQTTIFQERAGAR